MQKKMYQVEITVEENGAIALQQEGYGNEPASIWISVDQVDALIGWLKEAKEEVLRLPGETAKAFANANGSVR